ncbi:carbohydrate sulfotransferase 11-like [Macrobrachium rosenbergii]|uniref:carbohydrate sulfotransferase 11-like n=1 Tax=Macrobrachium rosenbergii TaxID=79674 RepID=UPI0034D4E299
MVADTFPQIGCSNWKRIWMVLRDDTNATSVDDISRSTAHSFTRKMELAHRNAKIDDVMKKMESYTKFIVVRNPIERLVSAYLDKIHYLHGTAPFQKQVLPFVKKQRESAQLADITLQEFLSFTFTREGKYNEHWISYESLCRPCQVNYDVILKLESIDEDAEKLLRRIGAPANLHYPNREKTVTTSLAEKYTKNLSSELIDGLIKEFGSDFLRFGYDMPERRK